MRFKMMIDYFEDYYRDSLEMNTLIEVEAAWLDQAAFDVQDVFGQTTIQQATWMIPVYEQIFGLEPDPGDSLDFRRKRLLAYQRVRSPTTRKEFKNYLLPFVETVAIEELFYQYSVEFTFTGEDINFREIWRMLRRTMPAHLAWQLTLKLYQSVKVRHVSEIMGLIHAHHNPWNHGETRAVFFDGQFTYDRKIRWDGIYGETYREKQKHATEIWYMVETWQRNLVPVNIWDGAFEFSGGHTWSGSPMQRLPLQKSAEYGVVETRHRYPVNGRHFTVAMNCPDVYTANPIKHTGDNQQRVVSLQPVISTQDAMIIQEEKVTQLQEENHVTCVMTSEAAHQKVNIVNRVKSMSQTITRQNIDYRTANLADGSFCMDGTHAFDGVQQQNHAQATHRCVITHITKNGYGRSELA